MNKKFTIEEGERKELSFEIEMKGIGKVVESLIGASDITIEVDANTHDDMTKTYEETSVAVKADNSGFLFV